MADTVIFAEHISIENEFLLQKTALASAKKKEDFLL